MTSGTRAQNSPKQRSSSCQGCHLRVKVCIFWSMQLVYITSFSIVMVLEVCVAGAMVRQILAGWRLPMLPQLKDLPWLLVSIKEQEGESKGNLNWNLMQRVSNCPLPKTTQPLTQSCGTKFSSKGCEEYSKPLSNHHTDSDPLKIAIDNLDNLNKNAKFYFY